MKTDNEKVAEFMGLTLKKEIDGIKYYNVPVGHIESYNASQGDFKYHKRWDWLMPVVEKIEGLGFATKFRHEIFKEVSGYQDIEIFSLNENNGYKRVACCTDRIPKIEAVYKAVVSFIDWYNENTSQTLKK